MTDIKDITEKTRCSWVGHLPIYQDYHDNEWGKPLFDEQKLFEMLCLEGQQAGLSWITVLKKREHYRHHFFQYSITEIANFSDEDLQEKVQDAGLIRHLAKLHAIRSNAQAWLKMQQQGVDMVHWLWQFVGHSTLVRQIKSSNDVMTQNDASLKMSKALKKQGFKFVGATTCYAFMQAVGMVDDHENQCFCKK